MSARRLDVPKPVASARAAATVLRAVHLEVSAVVRRHFEHEADVYEQILDALDTACDEIERAADDAFHGHHERERQRSEAVEP